MKHHQQLGGGKAVPHIVTDRLESMEHNSSSEKNNDVSHVSFPTLKGTSPILQNTLRQQVQFDVLSGTSFSGNERKRRTELTQKVATQLMKSAFTRQSNIFPVFTTDPDQQSSLMMLTAGKCTRSEKKLLKAPSLGIAAGVNAVGNFSVKYATARAEAKRIEEEERVSNAAIFSLWEARNAVRKENEELAAIDEELQGPLWFAFRSLLTESESEIMVKLNQMREGWLNPKKIVSREASSVPSHGHCAVGLAKGRESNAFGVVVASRGISFPISLYEKLFNQVIGGMHQHFVTMLRSKFNREGEGVMSELLPSFKNPKYIELLLKLQQELMAACTVTEICDESDGKKGEMVQKYPPVVSLPRERCFRGLLVAETGLSAVLLWRILDQARPLSPGMSWALQLYTNYILPHVYENFALHEQHLPRAGAIGEQVEQLRALRLNLLQLRSMEVVASQSQTDIHYAEEVMKRWTWRTWRQCMAERKRREVETALLQSMFERLHNAKKLQKLFSAWRLCTREGTFSSELDTIDKKYSEFLSNAEHAARNVKIFQGLEGCAANGGTTVVDKRKFVAFKLAETATHEKAQKAVTPRAENMDEGCASESAKKEATGAVPTDENETRECSPKVPMEVSRKDLFSFEARGGTPVKNECETVSVLGGADLGQRCASQQGEDRGHSPFILGLDEEPAAPPARVRVVGTFDEMIKKLEEMEAISGYLRQQIAIQNRIIKKLEQENTCLKDKVTSLEDSLFRSEGMRLFYCNQMQEKEQDLRHAQQMNLQLKSRLRSQEHRPWQRTVLRVLGDLCGASTAQSELEDESRIEGNKRPNVQAGNFKDSGFESGSGSPGRTPQASPLQVRRVASAGSSSGRSSVADANAGANNDSKNRLLNTTPMSEEERLFGQMAPIVLSSTRYMPDSQTILRDWANNCLDDLESLDGLRGGALTTRFHNFSQEVRSGVLLSRLLFYLALPRYQNKAVNKAQSLEGTRATMIVNFTEHRRRLLMQQNVQLDSPFPTYSDCFGDLLNMQPVSRMSLLMQFATELIEGYDHVGDKMAQMRLTQLYDNTISTLGLTVPTPVDKVDMQEIIDPNSLALGDRSAVITFIALLYVRFSHPFNHKAKESALIEKEAMLQLLSGGAHKRSQDGIVGLVTPSDASISPREGNEEEGRGDMFHAQKFIAELEEEEHSPWQLFLRHCQPLIGTMAHPYILRGNFWPSLSFDSPELVRILGSLGTALQRSLQKHRWHIIMSCLVPVRTYSALSRGVFTGSRASPAALQAGLERDGDWVFLSDLSCLKDVFETREKAIREAIGSGELKNNGGWDEEEWDTDGYFISEDRQGLMKAFETCGTDLLQLFLHHARLSNSCAMPALDLGNWRMLLIDVGLIMPDNPEEASLDLEQATVLFCRVMSSIGEVRGVSGSPEGTEKEPSRPPLPHFSGEMFYSEFVAALLLLLHELYPPVSTISTGERAGTKRVGWLGEALSDFTFKFVTPKTISFTGDQGSAIAKRICSNAKTHEVLVRHNKVLLAVFGHYSREVCGVSGIEKEQLLLMLRDAMITSTEISQSLILDLFKVCSVSKRTDEMHAEDRRRDNDARPRDSSAGRRRGNVSIVDPSGEKSALTSKTKEHEILLYEGFLEFICVICHFKQPNPLIPFEARLDVFLRRGLLRPLAHRNEGLASLMAYDKQRGQSDW